MRAGTDFVSGDRGNDTITAASAPIYSTARRTPASTGCWISAWPRATGCSSIPGPTYVVDQIGADTYVDMGGGNEVILVGVQMSSLTASSIFLG